MSSAWIGVVGAVLVAGITTFAQWLWRRADRRQATRREATSTLESLGTWVSQVSRALDRRAVVLPGRDAELDGALYVHASRELLAALDAYDALADNPPARVEEGSFELKPIVGQGSLHRHDVLLKGPDGSITVIEFKSARRESEDAAPEQLRRLASELLSSVNDANADSARRIRNWEEQLYDRLSQIKSFLAT